MQEEYIYIENKEFIIKRKFNNTVYEFARCDSLENAINIRNQLEKDGWPIKSNKILKENSKELNNNNKLNISDSYEFSFKIGKAYKHGFLVLTRLETYDLLPKLKYEDNCEIIIDDINSKARLNFVPRIVIDKKNVPLIEHLKELSEINPNQRNIVKVIKKDDIFQNNTDALIKENQLLKEKIQELNDKIEELYNFLKE